MERETRIKSNNKVRRDVSTLMNGNLKPSGSANTPHNNLQVLSDGSKRTSGSVARRYNLLAARLIAEMAKDLLGPRGLEKMFIDILGESTVTKDGATFLRKIDVEHPAAKVLIEGSNAVDNAVGDGTVSVVVLAGALIESAEKLLDMGISSATISEGYLRGMDMALEILKTISKAQDNSEKETMLKLAKTCLSSKAIAYRSLLSPSSSSGGKEVEPEEGEFAATSLVTEAIMQIADFARSKVDTDDIKIEEKPGDPSQTRLIKGIIIDKTTDSSLMPRSISNAKILLLDEDLEPKTTRTDAQISILYPQQYRSFTDTQSLEIMRRAKKIVDCGANVIISRGGISLAARTYFANAGIISVRRVKENDLVWLEKATGATTTRDLDEYDDKGSSGVLAENLGYAEQVYERFVGDDKMIFVEGCKNPKAVTLLLRAGSKRMLEEYHRSVLDAISVLRNYIETPSIVAGGGSTETIIAREIRKRSATISGREQIVIQHFADALEEIPLTIARNAGMNVIDTLAKLRSRNIPPSPSSESSLSEEADGSGYLHFQAANEQEEVEHIGDNNMSKTNNNRRTANHHRRRNHHQNDKEKKIVNGRWYGVNAFSRDVEEMFALGIIEPTIVKEQVIKTAVEVTNLLVRIDDVLMAKPVVDTHAHGHSHTHLDGTTHSHEGGEKKHDHYFDMLGKSQRPMHHYY
jgi:chaperonin GroEL (HSP60 family)